MLACSIAQRTHVAAQTSAESAFHLAGNRLVQAKGRTNCAGFYNELGAMHGTMMIFAGILPVGFAAFGNFVVPLQIGAHRSVGFEVGLAEWAKEEPFGLERDHRAEMYASARRAV